MGKHQEYIDQTEIKEHEIEIFVLIVGAIKGVVGHVISTTLDAGR